MMNDPTDPLFGISRIDQPAADDTGENHCWFVRLGWKNGAPAVTGSFSDLKYGGVKPSLQAAIAFRDEHLIRLRKAS